MADQPTTPTYDALGRLTRTTPSGTGVREYTLRDLNGKVLRHWEVHGWGAYQNPEPSAGRSGRRLASSV